MALANTLTKRDDLDAARGYYQKLIGELNVEREKYRKLYGPYIANERQKEVADLYMKATNNLGVILSEIASKKGDSSLNAKAIVNLQESVVSLDAINRDKKTMIRAQTSNLAEQNIKYIINPISEYKPQIYSEIKRLMQGEKVSN